MDLNFKMTPIRSNNPFRHSLHSEDSSALTLSLPPSSNPLQKTPSTTTTIVEEDEPEAVYPPSRTGIGMPQNRILPGATAIEPQVPQAAFVVGSSNKKSPTTNANGQVVITIEPTDSFSSSPPLTGMQPGHRLSIERSNQDQGCQMWPARRMIQKARRRGKRRWIILKVAIALVIVVGAVAVGMGISKSVSDTRVKQDAS